MPIVTIPIPEAYESSTRPIAVQLSKAILKDFAAPKNVRIVFPSDTGKIAQAKSTLTSNKQENFQNTDSTIHISVDESPIEERVLATATLRPPGENGSVFVDRSLGIYLRPIYTPVEATINFRLRFKDKTAADRYRNGIKTRHAMGRAEQIHTVSYHYGLPPEFVYMITEMHRIRETVEPLNETLKEWFQRCFDARLTTVTNQAGNVADGILAIPENQVGILGWYDFSYIPDKNEREHEGGAYTCGFDYKYQYDKVTDMVLEYPVIIHNQILPKTIRDDGKPYTLDTVSKTSQYSKSLFEFMQSQDPKYGSGMPGLCVPTYDNFSPARVAKGCTTILTVLIEVDPLNKKDLFNIEDIQEYEFNAKMIPFLKSEAAYISKYTKSIFYLNMYEDEYPTGPDKVIMDGNLNLTTVDDMDLRKQNRFHFGIINDLSILDSAALERLRAWPDALDVILQTLFPGYGKPPIMSNGKVSRAEMDKILYMFGRAGNMFTVGTYSIITQKVKDIRG